MSGIGLKKTEVALVKGRVFYQNVAHM